MSNNKVRMPRGDSNGQGHTIVGGRPAGRADAGQGIPRGLELLLKKAAVDEEFRGQFLADRFAAVRQLGLQLDPTEELMLRQIPDNQLQMIIRQTQVPPQQKSIFLGTSVAAMVALVTQFAFSPVAGRADTVAPNQSTQVVQVPPNLEWEGGARPDLPDSIRTKGGSRPEWGEEKTKGIRPDFPMPPGGARPDEPIPSPVPINVPVSPALSPYLDKPVQAKVTGQLFLEAIRTLGDEAGVRIAVEAPSGFDVSWTVGRDVAGMTLGEAIKTICLERTSSEERFQILPSSQNGEILLRFLETTPGTHPGTGEIGPAYPDHQTRGIRPDFPPSRKRE